LNRDLLQRRLGLTFAAFSLLVATLNTVGMLGSHRDWWEVVAHPSVWSVVLVGLLAAATAGRPHRAVQAGQGLLLLLLAAPTLVGSGSTAFFGPWFIVTGTLILHRYGLLVRNWTWKVAGIFLWSALWIVVSDVAAGLALFQSSLTTLAFLVISGFVLLLLYEDEIRDLMAANQHKDAELAERARQIARLEPLSVLGERVAHVTHSFKNNLNQISTALFLLEQVGDPDRAAAKLREFSQALDERIENILMVSRAGVDLEPELFDVARILEGMRQVYLQEPSFVTRAKTILTVEGPHIVRAVRWDFLLLVENILKNAVEAISATRGTGTVRIDLSKGVLTIANDGGPIALCGTCGDDCLACPRYGRPGQTTKAKGSGHGLAQVMTTCRANHWGLKIRTQEDWTLFEIRLTVPGRMT